MSALVAAPPVTTPPQVALLGGFFPVLLGERLGDVHASQDQAFDAARASSNGPASAVAVLRDDQSFVVHDLLTRSPDGTSFGGIRFEGAPRLPSIEQPMAGLVAIIDGASLIGNEPAAA